jgi:MFS family permease
MYLQTGRMKSNYKWIIVFTSFVTLLLTYGILFSIGVYFKPLTDEFGWNRTAISTAVMISMLVFGISQPLWGRLIDKYGPKRIMLISISLMGLGLILTSRISSIWQLYLFYGFLVGLGFSGAGVLSNAVIVSNWFPKKRGIALGITFSGVNTGQLIIFPVSMYLILAYDWRTAIVIMGLVLLLGLLPTILTLVKDGNNVRSFSTAVDGEAQLPMKSKLDFSALKNRSFWLLFSGFFICGYTGYGIIVHLPSYFIGGLQLSEMATANALAVLGGVSILGNLVMGYGADRIGGRLPLTFTYLLRGIALLMLMWINEPRMVYLFVIVYGFASFASVPLVSKLSRDIFGGRSIGIVLGTIWFGHALGQAAGSISGGIFFDTFNSYSLSFLSSAALLMIATILSYFIREKRG